MREKAINANSKPESAASRDLVKCKFPASDLEISTLRSAFSAYLLSRRLCKERKMYYRRCMKLFLSEWMELRVCDITMDMVEQKHQELIAMPSKASTTGRTRADMVMRALSTIIRFASQSSSSVPTFVKRNPVDRLRLNNAWAKYERRIEIIPDAKLRAFFGAISISCSDDYRDFLVFMILTGGRQSEVRRLEWSMVNFEDGTLTVPESISRYRVRYRIPLSSEAMMLLLHRRERVHHTNWVFESHRHKDRHIAAVSNTLPNIEALCGLHFRLVDIRKTFLVKGASLGIPYPLLNELTNRRVADITAGYIGFDMERMRTATQKISSEFVKLTGMKIHDLAAPRREHRARQFEQQQLLIPLW